MMDGREAQGGSMAIVGKVESSLDHYHARYRVYRYYGNINTIELLRFIS